MPNSEVEIKYAMQRSENEKAKLDEA
jgi:hypothetical protein